ncbi:MAG: hypothetical protein ABJB40_07530 [Acidobacteriota bacterium]
MKKYFLTTSALCLFITGSIGAFAQGPPKVLLIVREEIKTGMMAAHAREANGVVRIYAKAKSPYNRLAMIPVAGNENEVMYFWGFESFADLEKSNAYLDSLGTTYKTDFDQNAHDGEDYHSSQRDSLAVLREDLSYNIGAVDLPHMRYMRIQTVRVKPGHQNDFEEARKMVKAAHEKAKIDEHMAVFQLVGGAQSGTYLIIIPWKSLDGVATIPHGKSYRDALGDNNRDKLDKISNDSVVFESVDIYGFAPQLSYSSERMVAADPSFWTLKPMMPAGPVTAAKKPAAKTPKRP